KPRPETFLPVTNTLWFSNLLDACLEARVSRVILISFPHVEGPTTPESPAVGRLDGNPVSVHARTRLAQERVLMERTRDSDTSPVVLRLGMVYGRGVLMIDAARWLARHRLLGVWRDPTWVHLLSTDDFLTATQAAILKPDVHGIYHVGDEEPVSLQHFLDEACRAWRLPKPMRMPVWTIYVAAWCCEAFGMIARKPSPLTRDFVRIGRVSHVGDTRRAREELIPVLKHPSLESGVHTL
ncbi:MAG: NAD-dependent epimerase/dehydratase family protein, partial [Candidatus Krumholzibacteriota bacterium]|nr:NAD-dependent epimerase/dehydratase family protein [Candidatus Krumholzibacteriota bacterium]